MTNSTPKTNNKMERQLPKYSGKKRSPQTGQRNGGHIPKSSPINIQNRNTNSSSSSNHTSSNNNNGWRYKNQSPVNSANRSARKTSPTLTRNESPRGSPTNNSYYAGAKFSEPPSPASLPKPPQHWTGIMMGDCRSAEASSQFTNPLKVILNVQA